MLPVDLVIIEYRLDAPLQFVAVIFKADQQDTAAPENMLVT